MVRMEKEERVERNKIWENRCKRRGKYRILHKVEKP